MYQAASSTFHKCLQCVFRKYVHSEEDERSDKDSVRLLTDGEIRLPTCSLFLRDVEIMCRKFWVIFEKRRERSDEDVVESAFPDGDRSEAGVKFMGRE